MYTTAALALALTALAGAYLIYHGWSDRRDPTAPRKHKAPSRISHVPRTTRTLLAVGLFVGILLWIFTGWAISIFAAPLAIAGLPIVFAPSAAVAEINRLNALEEWARNLAGVTAVGHGLEQSILATARSVPTHLRRELNLLITRIRTNTPTTDALRRFADDVDDATADALVASLLQAAYLRGPGLTTVLESLSRSIAEDVRNRRRVEAERKQPRSTVRYAAIIIAVLLTYLFTLTDYMTPYKHGTGPFILAGFFAAFAGLLVWMRIIARPRKRARFIGTRTRTSRHTTEQPTGRSTTATDTVRSAS